MPKRPYEALAGRKRFNADTPLCHAIEQHEHPPLAQAAPGLDHSFASAVERAMAKDPADSAAAMAELLRAGADTDAHHNTIEPTETFTPTEITTLPKRCADRGARHACIYRPLR